MILKFHPLDGSVGTAAVNFHLLPFMSHGAVLLCVWPAVTVTYHTTCNMSSVGPYVTPPCVSVLASACSVHCVGDQGGTLQPTALPNSQHTLSTRGGRQLPRQLPAVGRFLHPLVWVSVKMLLFLLRRQQKEQRSSRSQHWLLSSCVLCSSGWRGVRRRRVHCERRLHSLRPDSQAGVLRHRHGSA